MLLKEVFNKIELLRKEIDLLRKEDKKCLICEKNVNIDDFLYIKRVSVRICINILNNELDFQNKFDYLVLALSQWKENKEVYCEVCNFRIMYKDTIFKNIN